MTKTVCPHDVKGFYKMSFVHCWCSIISKKPVCVSNDGENTIREYSKVCPLLGSK